MRQHPNHNAFIGQLQSSTGERIDVYLNYQQVDLRLVDRAGQPVKSMNRGLSIGVDQADILQGLLLNAKMRAGTQL